MSRPHRLATRRLAAWWRVRQVPVLYPIDLSDQETWDVAVPDDEPALVQLGRAAATARLSVFLLRAAPEGMLRTAVAVVGADDAALVDVAGDVAEVRGIGLSDAVRAIVDLLPDLPGAQVPEAEVDEAEWAGLVAALGVSGDPAAARAARAVAPHIPESVVATMARAAASTTAVGTIGVQVFVDGTAQLGPSLLSWQELPDGALLTHLHAPRRYGPTRVELGPYRIPVVLGALPEAVSTAQYRHRR